MKRTKITLSAAIALAAGIAPMTSCDATWGTSVGSDYGYYGSSIYNDYYPSLPGAPLLSPVYWGNQIYPGAALPPSLPPHRPGGPVGIVGSNRPVGNVRPGAGSNNTSTPTPLPDNIPVPSSSGSSSIVPPEGTFRPSGEPGVVMPPSGSGMRPAAGRH